MIHFNRFSFFQAFSVQAVFSNSVRNVVRNLNFAMSSFFDARIGLDRMQVKTIYFFISSITRSS